ncbi:MAG: hypothetical protein QG665_295 [Patescibacteria group bacterium]|nr:hypothetical protein [Patescibacteria group bacterium]
MGALIVIGVILVGTFLGYTYLNKPPTPPATPRNRNTPSGGTTPPPAPGQPAGAGAAAAAGNNQQQQAPAATPKKWGWGWIATFILLVAGVAYGGWHYGKTHQAPPPRWEFQFKRMAGQGVEMDTYAAKIARFDQIGDHTVFEFEVYYSDKDCGNFQTIFFEYDTRKGKSGRYHQSCPPDEGVWDFYQTGSRFNGTLKSTKLADEMMFELYRVQ